MKRTFQFLLFLIVVLFGAGCQKEALEPATPPAGQSSPDQFSKKGGEDDDDDDGDNDDDDDRERRRLKGTLFLKPSTTSLPCNCTSPSAPVGTYAGSGLMTVFGITGAKIQSCATPIIQNSVVVGYNVSSVCAELKAGNGKQIYTYTQPYQLLFGPSGATATLQVSITGGTGKYAGATGQFTGNMAIAPDLSATFTIDGHIIY